MLDNALDTNRRAYVREGLLLFGFVLLIVAGIATVVLPELSKTPDDDGRPAAAPPRK